MGYRGRGAVTKKHGTFAEQDKTHLERLRKCLPALFSNVAVPVEINGSDRRVLLQHKTKKKVGLPGREGNPENEERSRKKTKLTFKASLRAIAPASPNLFLLKLRSVTQLLTCTNKTTKDDGYRGG